MWRVDPPEGIIRPESSLDLVVTACLDDSLLYVSLQSSHQCHTCSYVWSAFFLFPVIFFRK